MPNYICYTAEGKITRVFEGLSLEELKLNLKEEELYLEGSVDDPKKYYISGNTLFTKPENPFKYGTFNYQTKIWEFNTELADIDIKSERYRLLSESDWTDTLSAQTRLGETLYNQWQVYRQALRDIPQQEGYPVTVIWPEKPI